MYNYKPFNITKKPLLKLGEAFRYTVTTQDSVERLDLIAKELEGTIYVAASVADLNSDEFTSRIKDAEFSKDAGIGDYIDEIIYSARAARIFNLMFTIPEQDQEQLPSPTLVAA